MGRDDQLEVDGGRLCQSPEREAGRGDHVSHFELPVLLRNLHLPGRRKTGTRQDNRGAAGVRFRRSRNWVIRMDTGGRRRCRSSFRMRGRAGSILQPSPPDRGLREIFFVVRPTVAAIANAADGCHEHLPGVQQRGRQVLLRLHFHRSAARQAAEFRTPAADGVPGQLLHLGPVLHVLAGCRGVPPPTIV